MEVPVRTLEDRIMYMLKNLWGGPLPETVIVELIRGLSDQDDLDAIHDTLVEMTKADKLSKISKSLAPSWLNTPAYVLAKPYMIDKLDTGMLEHLSAKNVMEALETLESLTKDGVAAMCGKCPPDMRERMLNGYVEDVIPWICDMKTIVHPEIEGSSSGA